MNFHIETSGAHPATIICLEALQWLHGRYECRNALEVGCGNGILALTACALWKTTVIAADISPQAVEDTKRQCDAHAMSHYVTVLRSDGFQHPLIQERAPYDLIICNLLAEPIVQWAPQMQSHLASGGVCILSGIQAWHAAEVEKTYKQRGFTSIHTLNRSPWVTYIYSRE